MTQRFVTSALLAAVALAGCSKKDKDKDKAPPAEPGSGSAMANTPPPAPPPAGSGSASAAPTPAGSGSAPAAPTGAVAKLADLIKITYPPPPKAAGEGEWKPSSETNVDGRREENWTSKDNKMLFGATIFDCRSADLKQPIGEWCAKKPDGKIKEFDRLTDPDSLSHGVRAGNLVVVGGPSVLMKDKITDADTDAWLGSLDLAAIAKL